MSDTQQRINSYCLMILAAIGLTSALIFTRPVLVPLVISLFIFAITSPFINFLQTKLKVPRVVSIVLTILIFLFFSTLLIVMVTSSIESFVKATTIYKERVIQAISFVNGLLESWEVNFDLRNIQNDLKKVPLESVLKGSSNFVSVVGNFSLLIIGNSTLIIIYVMFLIFGSSGTIQSPLINSIAEKISKYVATKFLMSLATGIITGLTLYFFGVDLAFMFAVLTILLNFIPSIGSIFAVLLPLPILLLEHGIGGTFFGVLIITASTQITIGNIIEPKLMGESMDLHPVVVMAFLTFWGLVWGVPGMFLAVPITAIIKIVLSKIESTHAISELLAGRLPNNL